MPRAWHLLPRELLQSRPLRLEVRDVRTRRQGPLGSQWPCSPDFQLQTRHPAVSSRSPAYRAESPGPAGGRGGLSVNPVPTLGCLRKADLVPHANFIGGEAEAGEGHDLPPVCEPASGSPVSAPGGLSAAIRVLPGAGKETRRSEAPWRRGRAWVLTAALGCPVSGDISCKRDRGLM